jgi:hypothetical protein
MASEMGKETSESDRSVVHIEQRAAATRQQIDTLLQVSGLALTALASLRDLSGDEQLLEGESLIAAENTFIRAFDRVDQILADDSRWNMAFQDQVEKDYHALAAQALEFQKAQTAASKNVGSPHFRYSPKLMKLTDGNWVALLGDPEDLDSCLLGVGSNPAEAITAFDEVFNGNIPKHVQEWLGKQEECTDEGKENPDPFPKYEQKNMDPGSGKPNEVPEIPGENHRRDSGDAGADVFRDSEKYAPDRGTGDSAEQT